MDSEEQQNSGLSGQIRNTDQQAGTPAPTRLLAKFVETARGDRTGGCLQIG